MVHVIRMPKLGMSMDEGTVVDWAVDEGGEIEEGTVAVVVESEKASHDIEAREDGVLREILVPEGGVAEPGTALGILAGPDDDLSEYADLIEEAAESASAGGDAGGASEGATDGAESGAASASSESSGSGASSASAGSGGSSSSGTAAGVKATPGAKRLAEEEGVDLAAVEGTGPQGVVTDSDVEAHLESGAGGSGADASAEDVKATPGAKRLAEEEGVNLAAVEGTGPQGVVTDSDVEAHLESGGGGEGEGDLTVVERRKLAGIQKSVSERLGQSYANAVHVTLNRSFEVEALREVTAAAKSMEDPPSASITDLLIKAVGDTLAAFPEFNALFEGDEHVLVEEVNVGVAVDIENGLVTPVIRTVDGKSAEAVNEARTELTERVQSGGFTMDDLSGGTFTISNLGLFGVDHFDPIINPPQVAILGVGRIRDDGTMTLSLSFDHRVVNGADAARFLNSLVERLTDATTLAGYYDASVPVEGALGDREIRVETASGFSGRYRTAYGDVAFDEPESLGGTGSAPSPVDHLLGALGSCLSLSLRNLASRDDVEVGAITTSVDGSPDHGALESVAIEVEVETDADDAAVEKVLTKAERACYVARSLSDDVEVTLDWVRA